MFDPVGHFGFQADLVSLDRTSSGRKQGDTFPTSNPRVRTPTPIHDLDCIPSPASHFTSTDDVGDAVSPGQTLPRAATILSRVSRVA